MLGFRYLKVPPTTYVLHYRGGKVIRQGSGLAYFYFAATSELVLVPLASVAAPFVFEEQTSDFQDVTVQGELIYRISDPKKIVELMDFGVDTRGNYRSEDPGKLNDRLVRVAQLSARDFVQRRPMREVLAGVTDLSRHVLDSLRKSPGLVALGVEVLELSMASLKPSPEIAKALQAEAREDLLRRADEAIYTRRNAAVEQERKIRENELNTEIAVEVKKRQVRETQMDAAIVVEERRTQLVDQRTTNERKEADARAYALKTIVEPLREVDWKTLMAAHGGGDAGLNVAIAFRELAENAGKIGELNVSPELLASLTKPKAKGS